MSKVVNALNDTISRAITKAQSGRHLVQHYDVRARRDVAAATEHVIGSLQPVDCSYCVTHTQVSYTPPSTN